AGLGMIRGRRRPLHNERANPETVQGQGQRQPHRTASHDEHRYPIDRSHRPLPKVTVLAPLVLYRRGRIPMGDIDASRRAADALRPLVVLIVLAVLEVFLVVAAGPRPAEARDCRDETPLPA